MARSVERQRVCGHALARARRGEPLADRPRSGRRGELAAVVAAHHDATLDEHRARWVAATGLRVGRSTVARELARLGVARKKKTPIARERDEAAHAAWRVAMAGADTAALVFRDETATPTTLTPLDARAPRGLRAIGRVPLGRRESVSWLATLTPAGIGESLLVPSLRPGQVVVLDTLSVHKSPDARKLVEAAGCRLVFLPTYSPDYNPVEQAFAKCKQALCRAAPRSFAAVAAAVGRALASVTASDARAFYRTAGFPA